MGILEEKREGFLKREARGKLYLDPLCSNTHRKSAMVDCLRFQPTAETLQQAVPWRGDKESEYLFLHWHQLTV